VLVGLVGLAVVHPARRYLSPASSPILGETALQGETALRCRRFFVRPWEISHGSAGAEVTRKAVTRTVAVRGWKAAKGR
jgi:hypothetical protein